MKCFVCNKDGEMGVGRQKIAEIAVSAEIARDRETKSSTRRRRDAEKNRIGRQACTTEFYSAGEGACGPQFELQG
jgi:alanyl-tRNA synthetase